ncbi:hypothetical protein NCLIV_038890 [Neospora caninum Liverpool]|uniref:Probable manganese transport protein mntH n=1 Tax=Neospora caninum (strain Liverpool) TaxID=572307 RepID=F0VAV6_NEOCL|nr:hypothetical protein NCLIV_038890 [Neospora caninum Liverpool]CBZ50814.1 hypothetical protein NCLIV_038890 [Neospora caninum Liverpool]CEL68115.1 TPA: Probable manganese transport protein mntH [Neospora caninum Liverpool]|eukprot:XP_003880847.1 hypothetical protein NCLIV_038890 [Neospora caninum Liverpool]
MSSFAPPAVFSDSGRQRSSCHLVSPPDPLVKPLLSEFLPQSASRSRASSRPDDPPAFPSSASTSSFSSPAASLPPPRSPQTPGDAVSLPSACIPFPARSLAQLWRKKSSGDSSGSASFASCLMRKLWSATAMRDDSALECGDSHTPPAERLGRQGVDLASDGREASRGQEAERGELSRIVLLSESSSASAPRSRREQADSSGACSEAARATQTTHAGPWWQTREGERDHERRPGTDVEASREDESEEAGEREDMEEVLEGPEDVNEFEEAPDFFTEFVDVPDDDEDQGEEGGRHVSPSPPARLSRLHESDTFSLSTATSGARAPRETLRGREQKTEHVEDARAREQGRTPLACAQMPASARSCSPAPAAPRPWIGTRCESPAAHSAFGHSVPQSSTSASAPFSASSGSPGRVPVHLPSPEPRPSSAELPTPHAPLCGSGPETEVATSAAAPLLFGERTEAKKGQGRRLLSISPQQAVLPPLFETNIGIDRPALETGQTPVSGHRFPQQGDDGNSLVARLLLPSPSPSLPLAPEAPAFSSNGATGSSRLSCAQSSCGTSECSEDDSAAEEAASARSFWSCFSFVPFSLTCLSSPCFLLSTQLLSTSLRGLSLRSPTPSSADSPVSRVGAVARRSRLRRCLVAVFVTLPLALLLLPLNLVFLLAQLLRRGVELLLPPPLPAHFRWKKFVAFLGPGWLVAMAYLDPGNLEGDLQAGSRREEPGILPPGTPDPKGHALLWVLLWGHAGGWIFQVLAARLGNATGVDLATLCRRQYSRSVAWLLWVLTEIAILGADIQAVIGCAVAFNLLLGLPVWVGVLVTLVDSFTFLSLNAERTQQLERVFSFFIGIMAIAFGYTLVLSKPSFRLIIHGLVAPTLPRTRADAFDLLALVGCIIMPHNIFLHSALVLTRNVKRRRPDKVAEANYYFSLEAALALAVSFVLNSCVLCAFANPRVKTPEGEDLTLSTAPEALQSAFGHGALYIWATGLLAAGQNAAMAGTYAGQFVMQGFLNLHFSRPVRLVLTRLVTILPVAVLADLDQAVVDSICRAVNIAQAFLLPFALVPLLLFSASPRVMGKFALNGLRWLAVFALALVVTAGNFAVAFFQLSALQLSPQLWIAGFTLLLLYAAVLILIARQKIRGVFCVYLLGAARQRPERGSLEGEGVEERGGDATERLRGNPLASAGHAQDISVLGDASIVPVSSGTDGEGP